MSIAQEIQRVQSAKANIKKAIEDKGVIVGDGTIDTYAAKISEISGGSGDYEQGYEDGKNSVVSLDRYLTMGRFKTLNMFKTPSAELNLDSWQSNMEFFIQASSTDAVNTTVEHLTVNCPIAPTSMQSFLDSLTSSYDDYTLKKLTLNFNTKSSKKFNYIFGGNRALEIIDGIPLDFSSSITQTNPFNRCYALIDVRFVANSIKLSISFANSPNLSTDTIQSIIDGLATVDTAQTLTLHANVKILQSQVDSANAKGWTIAGGTVVSEEEYYG